MSKTATTEDKFLALWREWELGPDPVRNYRFMLPERRLEVDFAWPDIKLGVEIQGGIYAKERSGHSSIPGLKRDMEKNNLAQTRGWILLQIEPGNLSKARQQELQELLIEAAQLQVSRKAYDDRERLRVLGEEELPSVATPDVVKSVPSGNARITVSPQPIRFSTILHVRARIRLDEDRIRRLLRKQR